MATKLIRLEDGAYVEVEADPQTLEAVSSRAADRVQASLAQVHPLIVNACRPVLAAWHELNREMIVDSAEVELALSFEGEGNAYIAKMKAGANLVVKITLRPPAVDNPRP